MYASFTIFCLQLPIWLKRWCLWHTCEVMDSNFGPVSLYSGFSFWTFSTKPLANIRLMLRFEQKKSADVHFIHNILPAATKLAKAMVLVTYLRGDGLEFWSGDSLYSGFSRFSSASWGKRRNNTSFQATITSSPILSNFPDVTLSYQAILNNRCSWYSVVKQLTSIHLAYPLIWGILLLPFILSDRRRILRNTKKY
jgi:hypothetical protein